MNYWVGDEEYRVDPREQFIAASGEPVEEQDEIDEEETYAESTVAGNDLRGGLPQRGRAADVAV